MKTYFTADWHLGDDRIGIEGKTNLLERPFKSVYEQETTIINNLLNSGIQAGDTLYHLGDVVVNENPETIQALTRIKQELPEVTFKLILGNYDEGKEPVLKTLFHRITSHEYIKIQGYKFFLNHYPKECINYYEPDICLVAHIHGLWRVQQNMINVGVDVWNYSPVSEDKLLFYMEAIKKYYDNNVFPYRNE